MTPGDDLAEEVLAPLLGDRRVQSHPVLLSAALTAAEWVGSGAPHGALVVADQQISPRGRAGRPWKVTPGHSLAFALILHPELASEREGWLYIAVLAALADVCGDGARIEWPDEIHRDGEVVAMAGVEVKLGGPTVKWSVVSVLIADAQPPRGELLRSVLEAIDARLASPPQAILHDYLPLCSTLGRSVRARLLGGTARLEGVAVDVLDDGSLVLDAGQDRRGGLRPQDISLLERL